MMENVNVEISLEFENTPTKTEVYQALMAHMESDSLRYDIGSEMDCQNTPKTGGDQTLVAIVKFEFDFTESLAQFGPVDDLHMYARESLEGYDFNQDFHHNLFVIEG